jgi:hypothetical protein
VTPIIGDAPVAVTPSALLRGAAARLDKRGIDAAAITPDTLGSRVYTESEKKKRDFPAPSQKLRFAPSEEMAAMHLDEDKKGDEEDVFK